MLVCYIQKYVIILGDIPVDVHPQPKYWGNDCVPGIPGGVDASGYRYGTIRLRVKVPRLTTLYTNGECRRRGNWV